MVKPDGVHRGLVGEIIKRFEQKGFKLVAIKFQQVRVGCLVSSGDSFEGTVPLSVRQEVNEWSRAGVRPATWSCAS